MSFNVNYPSTLSSIFSPFSQIGSSSEVFLSFDWFITDYEIKGPFPSNKLFKIFLSALLPIILIAVFSVIWFMIRLMKNGWVPNIKRNIIISFITIIFLFHPRLTQQSLLIFQWTQIDTDVMMTKVDTQIVCYSEEHIKWMFALGFPILIVWVISAPIIALILLIKHHKSNDNSSIKEYFLILYQGLKEDKFYWEFVNTLRKFLILSVFGMLSSISLRLGIIIGVIIMTAIMRLQQYLNPYKNEENNYIEIIAIEAAIVTIVAALIFLQENSIEILNVCILTFVITINARFLVGWIYLLSKIMKEKYKIFQVVSILFLIISYF